MKTIKKMLCFCAVLLAGMIPFTGCQKTENDTSVNYYDENNPPPTEAPVQEIDGALGVEAQLGGMQMKLISVEDPDITMEQTGKQALFFQVTIDNQTEETVTTNYLNNFSLTVDGTECEADDCCTLPVMQKLYDFYGIPAMAEEIPAGESRTGYIACEVEKGFHEIELHYTPKTTDRSSRITVKISSVDVIPAEQK